MKTCLSHFVFLRTKHILPYDETRVHLKTRTRYGDYVNASWIDIGNSRVISAESPLAQTVEHFLQMVQENGVSVIVTLMREEEQDDNGNLEYNRQTNIRALITYY